MNNCNMTNQKAAFQNEEIVSEYVNEDSFLFTNLQSQNVDKGGLMTSSIASVLDDSTPSDSGVQLLDSISSSGLNESFMSNSGLEFDISTPQQLNDYEIDFQKCNATILPDLLLPAESFVMTKSDIDNSNIQIAANNDLKASDDLMKTSTCSTFDTENIVYRRKVKKSRPQSSSGPKKRVSFHEDILKNTKTDNIHIEHGFITYRGKKNPQVARYSWCSEGDNDEYSENSQYYYRNACSDVLDYGKTDVYDKETSSAKYDNSGIFEYGPQDNKMDSTKSTKPNELYKCNCSSSNSSLDSGESDQPNENMAKRNYGQAKSSSCDCIGASQNTFAISDNCYFSEPNIDSLDDSFEHIKPKSVWSKEKKPKSSCLKSGKWQTINGVIEEHDLSSKVKKFNVHQLPDMHNLIDNSKMIFGSLKHIFGIPLPERGVPEGCEDQQSVYECIPEVEIDSSPINKPRPFLSKSFDGGLSKKNDKPKKYVHNVDEQMRRKHEKDIPSPITPEVLTNSTTNCTDVQPSPNTFRNKYIINCESTVFEHTGVSYETEGAMHQSDIASSPPQVKHDEQPRSQFSTVPFKQKLSNIIKSFRESSNNYEKTMNNSSEPEQKPATKPFVQHKTTTPSSNEVLPASMDSSMMSSIMSDVSLTTTSVSSPQSNEKLADYLIRTNSPNKTNRHLASPMRKKSMTTTRYEHTRMSPDLFGSGRDSKCTLSDEFDDILTITTTDVDASDSDLVIVDYPQESQQEMSNNLLRPPSTKSSLINRFLRNVTQKKIQDATIKKNTFLAAKIKNDKKLFENIYVKGVRPRNPDLIEDLNAEIALEIQMSGCVDRLPTKLADEEGANKVRNFGLGVGEIAVDIFLPSCLHILRDERETLMKVFKLYTGYSLEGHMTPVLVFLTDKTLYVTDLIRNRLFNKFVLPYSELDVILIGPHGNTVLLSNSARDMQQVLLAGGPYPADGLVSSLEMCARRGGSTLPAVGQLTLDHLAPLQTFVRENSSVLKNDPWVYYAVVSVPANVLLHDVEPLGPNIRGPLMYRYVTNIDTSKQWQAGYFLLKAGVLYMFNDAHQKIPNMALALYECKGARRAIKSNRPHCFELILKTELMQLAAPDEYVACEWLQALVQAASGLFEMQEKHKTLGCTLVMTSNHLITLREDFTAPLRRVNATGIISPRKYPDINRKLSTSTITTDNTFNETTSTLSGSTKLSDTHLSFSNKSSPSRNTNRYNPDDERSFTSMSSIYGKNSGIEVKTCASLDEMSIVRVPARGDSWWCILEFTCQEVSENSSDDDIVVFFATNSDLRRFLTMLETLWQSKNSTPLPISILTEDDSIGKHCNDLFTDLNKAWDPLISAALGYPQ